MLDISVPNLKDNVSKIWADYILADSKVVE